jgi:hypothetical protein
MAPSRCKRVPTDRVDAILVEKKRRKALDYVKLEWVQEEEDEDEDEDDEEDIDNNSDNEI